MYTGATELIFGEDELIRDEVRQGCAGDQESEGSVRLGKGGRMKEE